MRTPEAKIKAAILHPEEEVRLTALSYFSDSHTADEGIMPLVIEAVEKYGREQAFRILRAADRLPQSAATIQWLVGELAKDWDWENVDNDNYCFALALILCHAAPGLLKPEFSQLPDFPEELQAAFEDRLEMAAWDWPTGWTALEELGRDVRDHDGYRMRDLRYGARIVASLARHRAEGDRLVPLLHRRYRGVDKNLMEWLEPLLVELAGRMRLQAAAPILVARLHEDDFDLADSCCTALEWIGGEAVLQALAEQWPDGNGDFRRCAAEIMEHIPSDFGVQKCLEFLAKEDDDDTKDFLANALLANFAEEAVEPIRQMVLADEEVLNADQMDTKRHLVAACTVMGASFPEYEQWYKHAVEDNWGWGHIERTRIRENWADDSDDEEDWDDEEEEDWDDEDFDDRWDDELDEESGDGVGLEDGDYDEKPTPIRNQFKPVGRNEPCPCGSGKKYKKCCMNKVRQQEEQERQRTFPIGTVAFYGPDDKRTTKIAAGVIKWQGAAPLVNRWVGTNVKDNPKVQREIEEFFKQHHVKSVVASDGNMGCPHEEGADFPVGGDCPFCPWWKGKQGSGAKE